MIVEACSALLLMILVISPWTIFVATLVMMRVFGINLCVILISV
jgi:type III secretory pathway component EscS